MVAAWPWSGCLEHPAAMNIFVHCDCLTGRLALALFQDHPTTMDIFAHGGRLAGCLALA